MHFFTLLNLLACHLQLQMDEKLYFLLSNSAYR